MDSKISYKIRSVFWQLNRPFVWFFMKRKFNFQVESGSDAVPQPPFLVVANHANFFDPWFVGYQFYNALYIMNNADAFRGSALRRMYLEAIGTFPKKKGSHDYKAMKKTFKLLKSGRPVLIFPEGQTSWDGETQPVYGGMEKIILRAKCPVVMINMRGNFLSRPWWARYSRYGRIGMAIKVLQPDTLASMGEAEILKTMKSFIYNNDVKNPENRKVAFKGINPAEGIERFLWVCRHCLAEDCIKTSGNTVVCTACSAAWETDSHLAFRPGLPNITEIGDIHDWAQWHKEFVRDRIKKHGNGEVLTFSPDVVLQTEAREGKFVSRYTGTATLTSSTIEFCPANGAIGTMEWRTEEIDNYVIQLKDVFEFHTPAGDTRFVFNGHSPMKWIFYLRYLKGYEEIEKRGHY